jgi:hypothetical protein
MSETAAKRVRKSKVTSRKQKGRSRNGSRNGSSKTAGHDLPAAGTLARTKTLLLAALRVWELKHRVGD